MAKTHQPNLEAEILRALKAAGIAKAAVAPLARHSLQIEIEIARARVTESDRTPAARQQRLKRLVKISGKLGQLMDLLETAPPESRRQLNGLLASLVGINFSIEAFEHIGIAVDTSVSFRSLESREASSRGGPYRAMEIEVASARQKAGVSGADCALALVLSRVKQRIDMHVSLLRQSKGGHPLNFYRSYAIHELADAFQVHMRRRPTPTAGGKFLQLCEQVFPLLGVDTEGLDGAVERELRKRAK